MKDNFDLRKFINNEKASFLSEGYDEFQRADKGSKNVAKRNKAEKEVYGAGVEAGEKIEKEKLKEEQKELTYNDFITIVRNDLMAGASPDEYPSDERVRDEAEWKYQEYLKGVSLDDLFLYEATEEEINDMDEPDEMESGAWDMAMREEDDLKEKEGATAAEEDKFHRELDKLVHKTFGHSSDEKKEMKEDSVERSNAENDLVKILMAIVKKMVEKEEKPTAESFKKTKQTILNYISRENGPLNMAARFVQNDMGILSEEKNAGYPLGQALFKLQDEDPKKLKAWKKSVADHIKAKGTGKYMKWGVEEFINDFKKSLDEIGMFHDPVGYEKSKPNPKDQIYTKKFKSDGVYDIFKNDKKIKTITGGEGAANAYINDLKRGLNEVNIFDKDPYKTMLKDLMDKTGMSEKDAKRTIVDKINSADREGERSERRAFNKD